jgi:VanZ family protein
VQYFIPNRGASIGDLMADGLGALMGLVVVIYLLPNPKPLVQSE